MPSPTSAAAFAAALIVNAMLTGAARAETPDKPDEKPLPWSFSIDGGTSTGGGQGDQPFIAIGLTRHIGNGYVGLGASQIEADTSGRLGTLLPATTRQLKLSGGIATGPWSFDIYGAIGDRRFDATLFTRAAGTATLNQSGQTAGAGGSVTYDMPVGRGWFLSPSVSVDYSHVETERVLTGPGGRMTTQRQPEDGVTGTAGMALQRIFGHHGQHALALTAAFVTTSNDAAVNRSIATGTAARALGILQGAGGADSWGEFGAMASFGLTRRLVFNLSASRTAGIAQGDSTSVSGGFKLRF